MREDAVDNVDDVRDRFRQALAEYIGSTETFHQLLNDIEAGAHGRAAELLEQERAATNAFERYNNARIEYVKAILSREQEAYTARTKPRVMVKLGGA
jgi:hypothetical protein